MATETHIPELAETLTPEEEQSKLAQMQLEDKILRYFQNKEIAKERTEENKLLFEEIEQFFESMDDVEDDLVMQLPNGEYAVLAKKAYVKDNFDKEALAQEIQVAKDELKTPFDFSMFTAKGKITPDMISKHTVTETVVKVRLSKRKTKPRKKK
ncbi:MAG TPA: hypothetical protein VFV52_05095 [Bacilli bacterium]|nr:hypothetical protein [Bacilli bacterium]